MVNNTEDKPHPTSGITTSQIAAFQLMEEGFHGMTASATLLRCKHKLTDEDVVVVCVYRDAIEQGKFAVEPIAILIEDLSVLGPPLAGARFNGKYVEHMTFDEPKDDIEAEEQMEGEFFEKKPQGFEE